MSRSKSSKRWLKEHFSDQFVKQAQQKGWRSRAAFKLLAIQEKDKIFKPGMSVVDLGAAPGGWSQLITQWVGNKGSVIALDILPMNTLPGVTFIQGDFTQENVFNQLLNLVSEHTVDVIVSDMAPNLSGISDIDQPRAIYLAEIALEAAKQLLKPQGVFIVKMFQGSGFDIFLKNMRQLFTKVTVRKPEASRARSAEIYLIAKGYKI